MAFSVDSRLKDLIEDPGAQAVMRKHFPGYENHPRLNEGLYYSLREIANYTGGVSAAKLEEVNADLKAL